MARWMLALAGMTVVSGCSKPEETEDSEPKGTIVEDSEPYDSATWLLDDTGTVLDDTGVDPYQGQDPQNVLTIEYSGFWDFAGTAPNYTNASGELHIVESLDHFSFDGENKCYWIYFIDGSETEADGCADCDFAMEVTFTYDTVPRDLDMDKLEMGTDTEFETALGECEDYDLPPEKGDEPWILGFSTSTNTVYLNYGESGFWIPWYTIEADPKVPDRYLMIGEDNHYEYGFYYEYDTGML